jgi:hypothetical protein
MSAAVLPEAAVAQSDIEKTQDNGRVLGQGGNSDTDDSTKQSGEQEASWNWDTDPHNPYNWSSGRRALQVTAIASIAFLA